MANKPYDPNDPTTHVATPANSKPVVNPIYAPINWVNVSNSNYNPSIGSYVFPTGYGNILSDEDDDFEPIDDVDTGVVRCCGEEAKWVNNGVGFRYYYCTKCKCEVDHPDNDPIKAK